MGCFALDQEKFGVDNTGFEDSDEEEEVLVLKEPRKEEKLGEKCSSPGCQNMIPGKLLVHPKTNEYLCVKCYIACRPRRVCHSCYSNFKWERTD